VEGGSGIAAGLVLAGLVDRLEWFRAPLLLGGDGVPAIAPLGLVKLGDAPAFRREGVRPLGPDLHESYRRI
jgi:diaminohydroxyphosphoribosylaminopyrimidine deaminase/5-amino-6-(5-phosphoribosylamino)uracil reductase